MPSVLIIFKAKTNTLNKSQQITFITNEYSNILCTFSIELLAYNSSCDHREFLKLVRPNL